MNRKPTTKQHEALIEIAGDYRSWGFLSNAMKTTLYTKGYVGADAKISPEGAAVIGMDYDVIMLKYAHAKFSSYAMWLSHKSYLPLDERIELEVWLHFHAENVVRRELILGSKAS